MPPEPLGRAVFFDRDGVLIRTFVREGVPHPPASLDELQIVPEAGSTLQALADAGFFLAMVTNQPDVARGMQRREVVEQMNEHLRIALPLKAVYACYHDDADKCSCRKPRPGMLLAAAAAHGIDLNASFMVGDRWSDVEAGLAAGCRTLLIDRPYSRCDQCKPHWKTDDLAEAGRIILEHR